MSCPPFSLHPTKEKGHSNGGLSVPSGPSRLRSPQKRRGSTGQGPSGGKGSREVREDAASNERNDRNDRNRNGAPKSATVALPAPCLSLGCWLGGVPWHRGALEGAVWSLKWIHE